MSSEKKGIDLISHCFVLMYNILNIAAKAIYYTGEWQCDTASLCVVFCGSFFVLVIGTRVSRSEHWHLMPMMQSVM